MPSRSRRSARGPVLVAQCLLLACVAVAVLCAATAHASPYEVVFCAGGSGSGGGSGGPIPGARPAFFDWSTDCGTPPSYPAEGNSYLRLNENTTGTAGDNDEVSLSWYAPSGTTILAGGAYTREPNGLNEGWRARLWGEDWAGGVHNIMLQGQGIENGDGITKNDTSVFASHLWPFGVFGSYKRLVAGLWCVRPSGCSRAGVNEADFNTITLILGDEQAPHVSLVDAAINRGEWVRGDNPLSWFESDEGSGLRWEHLSVDGAVLGDATVDYQANGGCNIGYRDGGHEFGHSMQPCTQGPYQRWYGLETANIPDGQHTLAICVQDYAHDESCARRTIHTDNTPPGAPAGLEVTSANPARYLSHFGVHWQLPLNQGSPIVAVHYVIDNAAGEAVEPERTVSATNPSALSGIEGPAHFGAYTVKLWLEDQVGFQGAIATAPIPHDTTPPAAPQDLSVIGPSSWGPAQGYKLRWHDITDNGSPINTTYYQVLDASGNVVVPTQTVSGEGVQALDELEVPRQHGDYTAKLWLQDEEGNVGAAATAPIPRDTTPPAAPQGLSVTAPSTPRSAEGFDLRWHDITDNGSPIDAAHYQVLGAAGNVLVATQTVRGENVQAIQSLETPQAGGNYTVRLWLEDQEGNVGAAVTAPLAYECLRSDAGGGSALTAGLGSGGSAEEVVRQGQGSTLHGRLTDAGGAGVGGAPICVFSRVITDKSREFLGLAVSSPDGDYQFAIPAGASRLISSRYRAGSRELSANATIQTVVKPTFKVAQSVVHNKHYARFSGTVPGPDNNRVVVVLQVRSGKGWRAFRRYYTRDGKYAMKYRFTRTPTRTLYETRAQVRSQIGYPYLQGNSRSLLLHVIP